MSKEVTLHSDTVIGLLLLYLNELKKSLFEKKIKKIIKGTPLGAPLPIYPMPKYKKSYRVPER